MNTYLIPIYNGASGVYIDKVKAKNIEDAKQRIIDLYLDDNDEVPADWDDFLIYIDQEYDYIFGDFYELSEFE